VFFFFFFKRQKLAHKTGFFRFSCSASSAATLLITLYESFVELTQFVDLSSPIYMYPAHTITVPHHHHLLEHLQHLEVLSQPVQLTQGRYLSPEPLRVARQSLKLADV